VIPIVILSEAFRDSSPFGLRMIRTFVMLSVAKYLVFRFFVPPLGGTQNDTWGRLRMTQEEDSEGHVHWSCPAKLSIQFCIILRRPINVQFSII